MKKKTNMQTLNAATNWVRTGQKVTHSMQMLLSIASCWLFSLMSLLLPFLDVHLPLDLYELRFRCGDWKATHVCWSQQTHNFRACVKRTRLMSSTARKKTYSPKVRKIGCACNGYCRKQKRKKSPFFVLVFAFTLNHFKCSLFIGMHCRRLLRTIYQI